MSAGRNRFFNNLHNYFASYINNILFLSFRFLSLSLAGIRVACDVNRKLRVTSHSGDRYMCNLRKKKGSLGNIKRYNSITQLLRILLVSYQKITSHFNDNGSVNIMLY